MDTLTAEIRRIVREEVERILDERQATSSASAATDRKEEFADKRFLSTIEAAAYLGIAASTLRNRKSLGTGPAFVNLGRLVKYQVADLDAWAGGTT